MSRLHTHHRRAKRALAKRVYAEAFAFHHDRVERLMAAGRLDKLTNSGFVRRMSKRERG